MCSNEKMSSRTNELYQLCISRILLFKAISFECGLLLLLLHFLQPPLPAISSGGSRRSQLSATEQPLNAVQMLVKPSSHLLGSTVNFGFRNLGRHCDLSSRNEYLHAKSDNSKYSLDDRTVCKYKDISY